MEHVSSAEISNIITSKEHELSEAITHQSTVEQEILLLMKQILELQFKKKDLQMAMSKANQNVRLLNGELRILRSQFFNAKNSGL